MQSVLLGVLQVEAMAQLGGILMIDPENEAAKNNFFFGGVDNCKWRKPVVPGDCLVSICTNLNAHLSKPATKYCPRISYTLSLHDC